MNLSRRTHDVEDEFYGIYVAQCMINAIFDLATGIESNSVLHCFGSFDKHL